MAWGQGASIFELTWLSAMTHWPSTLRISDWVLVRAAMRRAIDSIGMAMPARMARIAVTTSSSSRVKPRRGTGPHRLRDKGRG